MVLDKTIKRNSRPSLLAVERMLPQFCVVLMKESHPVLSFLALFLIKTIACSKTHDIRIISSF
jgi:hypothetical protein